MESCVYIVCTHTNVSREYFNRIKPNVIVSSYFNPISVMVSKLALSLYFYRSQHSAEEGGEHNIRHTLTMNWQQGWLQISWKYGLWQISKELFEQRGDVVDSGVWWQRDLRAPIKLIS